MTTRIAGPAAAVLIALVLIAIGCTTPTVVVPSPTTATVPPIASPPTGSPDVSPRALRPFTGVVPIALQDSIMFAPDRGRVAFVNDARHLVALDAGARSPRLGVIPRDGFFIELDRHGLRGDALVFRDTRTDGGRTDMRIRRADLATAAITTLDDHSGPFLGGGDTWRPRAPITNGRDVAWIRVDDERTPFGVHVVLSRAGAQGAVLHSGTSAAWIDLDDRGRVLISTLIGAGQVAELVLWHDGARTPLGTRPSGEGGPAFFVGDRVFWQTGSGIVARSEGGELIEPGGPTRPVRYPDCGASGATGRYLLVHCGSGTVSTFLFDPATGDRLPLPGVGHAAGSRAVVWREGTQWWLGTIAP